jgi:ribosomal protein S16
MLTIRFQPTGRKHLKLYRVVVTEKANPLYKFKEVLGWYNPHTKECNLNKERVQFYIDNRIELSDSVESLFKKQKIVN